MLKEKSGRCQHENHRGGTQPHPPAVSGAAHDHQPAATVSALPPSSIKNILYGKSQNPKLLTIKLICDGLDITLGQFFSTPEFDGLEQELE